MRKDDVPIEKSPLLFVSQNITSTGATNSLVHAASIVSWLSNVTGAACGT